MLHEFPCPDRVAVGTLGPVGERRYVLQVRQQDRIVTVSLNREAVVSVVSRVESLLKEAAALGWIGHREAPPPDLSPLEEPIQVLFEVRALGWALDLSRGAIQLELYSGDAFREELTVLVQVWLYPSMAREFTSRAHYVLHNTDPPCPFCGQPVHAKGHICPRRNGYRAPLFRMD